MKIQLLTKDKTVSNYTNKVLNTNLVVNNFHSPESFNDFDINIVDLTDVWVRENIMAMQLIYEKDFQTIGRMIEKAPDKKVIIIFPRNVDITLQYNQTMSVHSEKIKDRLDLAKECLESVIPFNYIPEYNPSKIEIDGATFEADFVFSNLLDIQEVLKRENSDNDYLVVKRDNIYLTTLTLNQDNIDIFINNFIISTKVEVIPDWFEKIIFDNDTELNKEKDEKSNKIREIQEEITTIDKKLEKNALIKSIVYTDGNKLVSQVINILNDIYKIKENSFVDENREDYNFVHKEKPYVVEIKGVKNNVKKTNISQLFHHVQYYIQDHPSESEPEIIALLIMNHQKDKVPSERVHVHENDVKLAKHLRVLIIETPTLLEIYGLILKNDCRAEVIKIIESKTGLLAMDDFKDINNTKN